MDVWNILEKVVVLDIKKAVIYLLTFAQINYKTALV